MKTETATERSAQLRRLINGYQVTQAMHVLVVLGVPDQLESGPRSASELARAVGANESALYRVMRAAAALGVLAEGPNRTFELTALGDGQRSGAPESLAGWAAFVGRPYHQAVWARLIDGVRTGENPFRREFGTDIWTYRQQHPDEAVIFNRAMNSMTGTSVDAIASAHDFSRYGVVVDVGGGGGALLIAICQRHLSVRGILYDLPNVVVDSKRYIDEAGLSDRVELVGGSFLEQVPRAGDAYVVKSVLHNWQDDSARRILANCHREMRTDSHLLVIERVLPGPNEGADVKLMDLNMFVGPNAYERSRDEWEQLLAAGGFRLARITPAGAQVIIEASPT